MKIKPFQQQGNFTIFDNIILDYILPRISGSEWKILSVIIRKTVGWHKEQDELSFSQIRRVTGIKSDATVAKSLNNLERAGYIQVDRPDNQWASNIYALNLDFEMDIEGSTSENEVDLPTTIIEAATKIVVDLTTKNVVEPATKNKAGSTTENEDTKEREKDRKRKVNKSGANAPKPEKKPTPAQEMFGALADLCKYDLALITEKERGQLNQAEKKMRENGISPATLKAFSDWWYENDWRGQKNQPPTISDMRLVWRQFTDYQKEGNHAKNQHNSGGNSKRSGIKGLRELGSDNPIKPIFDPSTGEDYYIDARTGQRTHPDGCPCYDCHPEQRAELP